MPSVDAGRSKAAMLIAGAALASAFGCAGVIGLGDLERVDDLDGSVPPGFDAGDAPVSPDGGDGGPCIPTGPEICDDGIDNDCNGREDCADPACTADAAHTCIPVVPTGWSVVAFVPNQRPAACPSGYATPTDLSVAPASNGTCSCSCTGSGGQACSASPFNIGVGQGNCTGQTENGALANGACTTLTGINGLVQAGSSILASTPAGPATCNPSASNTIGANPPRSGKSCELPKTGGGCASGVCAKTPGAPYAACVQRAGAQTCPAGYPNRTLVGTGISDTRSCTACNCVKVDCRARVELYNNGACNGAADMTAFTTNTCNATANTQFNANAYLATVLDGGCRPAAPVVLDGGVTVTGETTVCCR
jgi:hypothetical protein